MTSRIRVLLSVFALVSLGVAGCSSTTPRQVQQSPESDGTRPMTVHIGRIPGGTIALRTKPTVHLRTEFAAVLHDPMAPDSSCAPEKPHG